jgi:hypothetical protein
LKGEIDMKLRIAHYPQVPCAAFYVDVVSFEEAKKIMDTLAYYDLFQYHNKIKPDYANMTVLEEWNEEENAWLGWMDIETGIDDVDEYLEYLNEQIKE